MSSSEAKRPPIHGQSGAGRKHPMDTTQVVRFALPEKRPAKAQMAGSVTILTGHDPGAVFEIKEGHTEMGRSPDVQIPIADAGLSRRHARISMEGDDYFIEDLGSTNGTFLDGVKLTERRKLINGARIQVGETTVLRFALQDQLEQEAAKRMYEMTVRDPLTGLHNRRHLDERFQAEFAFAVRHRTALTAFVVDVDYFKKINDTLGHPAGDEVLRAMAATLQKMVRTEDLVARFGGEEFVVLARSIDERGTVVFAERLRATVENLRVPWEGDSIRLTISVGVAHYDTQRPYVSAESMLAAADGALYRAKNSGRNRVVLAEFQGAPSVLLGADKKASSG